MSVVSFPPEEKIAHALLHLLRQHGGPESAMRSADTYELLADEFGISSDARQIPRSDFYVADGHPTPVWHNKCQYARWRLVKEGLLEREAPWGIWMLSERGKIKADA